MPSCQALNVSYFLALRESPVKSFLVAALSDDSRPNGLASPDPRAGQFAMRCPTLHIYECVLSFRFLAFTHRHLPTRTKVLKNRNDIRTTIPASMMFVPFIKSSPEKLAASTATRKLGELPASRRQTLQSIRLPYQASIPFSFSSRETAAAHASFRSID